MFTAELFKMAENSMHSINVHMYLVEIPHWVLYNNKSEQTTTMFSKLYEPHAHNVKQNIPGEMIHALLFQLQKV